MTQWRPSTRKLYGYPCVEQPITLSGRPNGDDRELMLAGKHGLLYPFGPGLARIYLFSQNFRTRHNNGNCFLTIPESLVPEWKKKLKVPSTRPAQARIANEIPDGK